MKSYSLNSLKFIGVILVLTILAFAETAVAAPTNDNIANAQLISGVSGKLNWNNIGATKEAGEANHAKNRGGSSVWFKFVAPGNGVLHVRTGGNLDSLVAVYASANFNGTSADYLLGENDNFIDSMYFTTSSSVTVGTTTGVTYLIAVDGKNRLDGAGADADDFSLIYEFVNAETNDNFATPANLTAVSSFNSWTTTNVGASKESGEPVHMNNAGGKSIWFRYKNINIISRRITFNISGRKANSPQTPMKLLFAVYTGSSVNSLTPVLDNSASPVFYTTQQISFLAAPSATYYIAIDGYDSGQGADTGTISINYGVSKDNRIADFDNDGKPDLTVFRPTSGIWYSLDSGTNNLRAVQWGTNADKPLISKTYGLFSYYNVFRPDTGIWYATNISNYSVYYWGTSGDVPFIYYSSNPDGTSDSFPAVFRPSTGTWWFSKSVHGQNVQWGQNGDIPSVADFDGDGTDEIAVFRPSNGVWYILNLMTNQTNFVNFGLSGDKPVVADYDDDGKADIAVFRPSNGTWYYLNSNDGSFHAVNFGTSGDIPQPADYNGDGRIDLAVYRNGSWWILDGYSRAAKVVQWGLPTDIPVTSPVN